MRASRACLPGAATGSPPRLAEPRDASAHRHCRAVAAGEVALRGRSAPAVGGEQGADLGALQLAVLHHQHSPAPEQAEGGRRERADDVEAVLAVDSSEWLAEIPQVEEWFAKFGDKLPAVLWSELDALKSRLNAA